MNNPAIQQAITIACTVLASSGFWALIQRVFDRRSSQTKLLIGIGHDRIMCLAAQYLERGDWITADEYENLHDYLYQPYVDNGGNGAAKRIMEEVQHKLRIVKHPPVA